MIRYFFFSLTFETLLSCLESATVRRAEKGKDVSPLVARALRERSIKPV
jgi:hypothetical protein